MSGKDFSFIDKTKDAPDSSMGVVASFLCPASAVHQIYPRSVSLAQQISSPGEKRDHAELAKYNPNITPILTPIILVVSIFFSIISI